MFSPTNYFNDLANSIKPELHFQGQSKDDWQKWRAVFYKKYLDLLGRWPEKCDLNATKLSCIKKNEIIEETWIFNSESNCKVKASVLIPGNISDTIPAILCCHGHAYYGRHNVIGMRSINPIRTWRMKRHNYGFAYELAKRGFITIAIDMRGFNERGDGLFPYSLRRDKCNVNHIKASILGYNLVTLHLWDQIRTLDFIEEYLNVNSEKIGVTGISLGGTIGLYLAALDKRISASAIVCALTSFPIHSIQEANSCGSQFIPGIYQYGDLSDIAGLIAPRPVLFASGSDDYGGFYVETAKNSFRETYRIYSAAGFKNRCEHHIFKGRHEFNTKSVISFFNKHFKYE